MSPRVGRPPKLRPEDAPKVQALVNSGARLGSIAATFGVSMGTLADFRTRHGIERRRSLPAGADPERITEAFDIAERYLNRLPERMRNSGTRWTAADQEAMRAVTFERMLAALNSYDPRNGVPLGAYLRVVFGNALKTHISEDLERRAGHVPNLEDVCFLMPGEDGEGAGYFLRNPNFSNRIPLSSDDDDRKAALCDTMRVDPIDEIVAGMRRPSPNTPRRPAVRGTRMKICPACQTGTRGKTVTASSPRGLADDDSRRTPCPYCYGRGRIIANPVYISGEGRISPPPDARLADRQPQIPHREEPRPGDDKKNLPQPYEKNARKEIER